MCLLPGSRRLVLELTAVASFGAVGMYNCVSSAYRWNLRTGPSGSFSKENKKGRRPPCVGPQQLSRRTHELPD